QSSIAAGTPMYMSPEAFCGKRNVQTDLWSVGIILYLLLTGYPPFPQENLVSLIKAVTEQKPKPLPPSLPSPLHAVLLRALDKEPLCRFRSAMEMIVAIRAAYAGAKIEFFNPDASIIAPFATIAVENEEDSNKGFTEIPKPAEIRIDLMPTTDSATFAVA